MRQLQPENDPQQNSEDAKGMVGSNISSKEEVKSVIKIGDEFDCKAFGKVEVIDIYQSVTQSTDKIYEIEDEFLETHLATAEELDDYENKRINSETSEGG